MFRFYSPVRTGSPAVISLGADLALSAQQVTGVKPVRELPVVMAVFKGSLRNKFILVPAALLISAFIPWAVTQLLMLGGGILTHGFSAVHHAILSSSQFTLALAYIGSVLGGLVPTLLDALFGTLVGAGILGGVTLPSQAAGKGVHQ